MNALFAFDPVVVVLIAMATVAGMGLAAWRGVRRNAGLIALQPVAALLLLAALSVRDAPSPSHLIVLTPGADVDALETVAPGVRVALPGAPAGEGVERVPDLATALRRHPARSLHVVGEGLQRHDRDAVGTRALSFTPARTAQGATIVELDAPARVRAGTWWRLQGRVRDAGGAIVVLLDPAGAKVATATPDAEGRFALDALARAEGRVLHELRLQRDDNVLQSLPVPVVATSAPPLRALLLAASPSPELKYLRRWALDAGVALEARIELAPGLGQRRGDARLDAARLAELDLLIVDERSWPQLANVQPALREAVAGGLGLMARVTGPVPERVAREWQAWGIEPVSAGKPAEVRLPAMPRVAMHAWAPARGEKPDGAARTSLVVAADGTRIAEWHALGRGRVGVWRLADSHRLYTRGDRERHATLWSDAFSALARPRGAAIDAPARARIGERAVACGLAGEARVETPQGEKVSLAIERGCAAIWPRSVGWHRLMDGENVAPFYAFAREQIAALHAEEVRAATQALVRTDPAPGTPATAFDADRRRALLLAAWLGVFALLGWLERRARQRR